MHEERSNKHATTDATSEGALPAYLLDREGVSRSKILSNTVKQKRKEKAGKWTVPVPKVNPIADAEMFRVLSTGKRKQKQWKRMITKVTFVGEGFTRKPPKYERFSIQESARYSPRIEDNVLPGHYRSEEEPAEQIVHRAGSDHEGNDHRGECERVGIGDRVGKGRVG